MDTRTSSRTITTLVGRLRRTRGRLSAVLVAFGAVSGCGVEDLGTDEGAVGSSRQALAGAVDGAPGGHEVRVETPKSGGTLLCSGSLVRNNVVTTARHCISGATGTIRVRRFNAAGAQTGSFVDVAAVHRASTCDEVPGLCPADRAGDTVDFALLQLAAPMELDGATENGFRATTLLDPAEDTVIRCSGQGRNTCTGSGGVGTNRFGDFVFTNVTSPNRMHWQPVSGELPWMLPGDSGSGCWLADAPGTKPQLTTTFVTTDGCGSSMRGEVLKIYRPWLRAKLGELATSRTLFFDAASEEDQLNFVNSTAADWTVSGSALVLAGNLATEQPPGVFAGPTALARGQVMAEGCLSTRITSPDDDSGGLVFAYADTSNYYRFRLFEPNRVLLEKIRDGQLTTLDSANVAFDWSSGVDLIVCIQHDRFFGAVNNIGRVESTDRDFSEGRVGVYNRNLANAHYGHFSVSHGSNIAPEF
jgi:hypothetical protein